MGDHGCVYAYAVCACANTVCKCICICICLCIPSCGCGGDGGREWGVREHETRDHIYITTIVFLGLCTTEDWYTTIMNACMHTHIRQCTCTYWEIWINDVAEPCDVRMWWWKKKRGSSSNWPKLSGRWVLVIVPFTHIVTLVVASTVRMKPLFCFVVLLLAQKQPTDTHPQRGKNNLSVSNAV